MHIAEKIKRWMADNGVLQEPFAEASGVSQSALSHLLQGKTKAPSFQHVLAYARTMGCDVAWLIDEKRGGAPVKAKAKAADAIDPATRAILDLVEKVDARLGPGTAETRLLGGGEWKGVEASEAVMPPRVVGQGGRRKGSEAG